jgi:hypothetical protein
LLRRKELGRWKGGVEKGRDDYFQVWKALEIKMLQGLADIAPG